MTTCWKWFNMWQKKRSNVCNDSMLEIAENTLTPKSLMAYTIPWYLLFCCLTKIHEFRVFNDNQNGTNYIICTNHLLIYLISWQEKSSGKNELKIEVAILVCLFIAPIHYSRVVSILHMASYSFFLKHVEDKYLHKNCYAL